MHWSIFCKYVCILILVMIFFASHMSLSSHKRAVQSALWRRVGDNWILPCPKPFKCCIHNLKHESCRPYLQASDVHSVRHIFLLNNFMTKAWYLELNNKIFALEWDLYNWLSVLILGITVNCVTVPELFHVLSPFPSFTFNCCDKVLSYGLVQQLRTVTYKLNYF